MYRVIIADDEESVRNRLKTMVEKFSDDFMVVGCFENGFDTLESGSHLEPDILITDIRMPYISGIELIRHLKMDFPLMQFIIVSGYDSFDYAKEAISLGVAGYLTKPVSSLEMKGVLYKAKDALDKQLQMDLSIKNLEVKAKTSMRFLQSEDLNRLIKLKQIPANFANKLVEDGIDLNHLYQVMAVYDADSDELEFDRQDLLYFSLKKAIDEEFASCLYYFFLSDNQMILLLQKDEKFNDEELMLKFNGILAMVKRAASISVSCGVSDIMNAPVNYRKMYRHAKRSLEYRTVLGSNMVFSFEDLEKVFALDLKELGESIEIEFSLGEYDGLWVGKTENKTSGADVFWLSEAAGKRRDFTTFQEMSEAKLFDGKSLKSVWADVTLTSANDHDMISWPSEHLSR